MPSCKKSLDYYLSQINLNELSYRQMMGEYILYFRDRIVGGIYDDMLLIKPVKVAIFRLPNAEKIAPYDGAKEMILVPENISGDTLRNLFIDMYPELPTPKTRKNGKT